MITDKILLDNGYKEYGPNIFVYPYSNRFFQKRCKNEKGQTKYFINFVEYGGNEKNPITYEIDLQFEKENYTMNLNLFALKNMTLEDIEQEVYAIWYGLDCKYYEY